jgi:hypothetical protein
MTLTVHGIDEWLLIIAALFFLIVAIVGWVTNPHPARAYWTLLPLGLLAWVLAALVH